MIETSEISFDKQNRISDYDALMSSELNDYRIFEFSLYLTQIYLTETKISLSCEESICSQINHTAINKFI